MTEKEKVLKAIEKLKHISYSCHALRAAGVKNNTMKLYQKFLVSHYPMFFKKHYISGFGYSDFLDSNTIEFKIFDSTPTPRNRKIRTIFLKQFAEYL